ncbi:MAG: hypothetical protein KFH98_07590 [Gemmatimonadetes bacterium]|nr:hypothetical protein [Gemmatimonadota bacterium]
MAVVVVIASVSLPRAAGAATAATCMDDAWAEYNECLVEAMWEFHRKICDLEFHLAAMACARALTEE